MDREREREMPYTAYGGEVLAVGGTVHSAGRSECTVAVRQYLLRHLAPLPGRLHALPSITLSILITVIADKGVPA
jgi:hypothetical protein